MNFETFTQPTQLTPFGLKLHVSDVEHLKTLPIRELVFHHRLVLIRGLAPLAGDDFLNLITTLAGGLDHLLRWDFGYLMEVKEDPTKDNYLFTSESVPLHWDGAFHVAPSILAFQCKDTEGDGGETVFSDTAKVWDSASSTEQVEWSKLTIKLKTDKKAHYGGQKQMAMVATHPATGQTILRFAERVTTKHNPVDVALEGEASIDWLTELPRRLYSQNACFAHSWQKGDILFADNFALLHGRRAYGEGRHRCLQRVQIL